MTDDAAENYAGVYDGNLGFGKTPALILVDFVQAYFDKSCDLYADVDDVLTSALALRDAARASGLLIIYTNVVYQPSMVDGGRFVQKVPLLKNFVAGHPMRAWPDGLEPTENELVISKQYPSAFFGTSLASTLTANGIDSLIITGLTTSGCVRATCVDCCSHGFIPIVAEEAVGDRAEAPHRSNLFDMQAKYADVRPVQEITDYLLSLTAAR